MHRLNTPLRPCYFHQITVDGDTSTNDTVIGLASGAAGGATISSADSTEGKALEAGLTALLQVRLQYNAGGILCEVGCVAALGPCCARSFNVG